MTPAPSRAVLQMYFLMKNYVFLKILAVTASCWAAPSSVGLRVLCRRDRDPCRWGVMLFPAPQRRRRYHRGAFAIPTCLQKAVWMDSLRTNSSYPVRIYLRLSPLHLHRDFEGGWHTRKINPLADRWVVQVSGFRPQLCCSKSLTKIRA